MKLKILSTLLAFAYIVPTYACATNEASRNEPQDEAHEQTFCTRDKKELYLLGAGMAAILIAGYCGGLLTHDTAARVATSVSLSTQRLIDAARNFTLEDAKKFGALCLMMATFQYGAMSIISSLVP